MRALLQRIVATPALLLLPSSLRLPTYCSPGGDNNDNPAKRGLYCEAQLNQALQVVGTDTYRKISDMYGVPKSTLFDAHRQLSKGPDPAVEEGRGARGVLNEAQEAALVKHIRRCAENHASLTISAVCQEAYKLAAAKPPTHPKYLDAFNGWKPNEEASTGWWRKFKKRHPEVSLCDVNAMETSRSNITQAQLDSYTDTIAKLYETYPHLQESRYWFDTDETPLQAGGRECKVVTVKGVAANKTTSSNDKLKITILPCICANGTQTPPLIIVPGELLTTPGWWATVTPHLMGTALETATCVSQARSHLQFETIL